MNTQFNPDDATHAELAAYWQGRWSGQSSATFMASFTVALQAGAGLVSRNIPMAVGCALLTVILIAFAIVCHRRVAASWQEWNNPETTRK